MRVARHAAHKILSARALLGKRCASVSLILAVSDPLLANMDEWNASNIPLCLEGVEVRERERERWREREEEKREREREK